MSDKHSQSDSPSGPSKALVFGLSAALGLCIAILIYLYTSPGGARSGDGDRGPDALRPRVKIVTTMGDIVLELEPTKAPVSVANFLDYVDRGHYAGTIFHRVARDFVVQGGGFEPDLTTERPTGDPIINESDNGLKNVRGSLAMARTQLPDSATAQFYINLKNNDALDFGGRSRLPGQEPPAGYTVFGRVINGMDIVDKIGRVPTKSVEQGFGQSHDNVPVEPVIIKSATRVVEK